MSDSVNSRFPNFHSHQPQAMDFFAPLVLKTGTELERAEQRKALVAQKFAPKLQKWCKKARNWGQFRAKTRVFSFIFTPFSPVSTAGLCATAGKFPSLRPSGRSLERGHAARKTWRFNTIWASRAQREKGAPVPGFTWNTTRTWPTGLMRLRPAIFTFT